MKKIQSLAEVDWRKKRWDERWEKRVEYLESFFSGVSTMLPRQITHLKSEALNPNPIHIILDKAIWVMSSH